MIIQINQFSMAVDHAGEGTPLLLIHGFPLSRELWNPQTRALTDIAQVIAPDLRGYGESDPVPGPYTMDLLADDCFRLLETLGITEPVVVCGLSMGGYIAFSFYRNHPERVAGLILAATRAGDDSPEAKANRDAAIAKAREMGAGAIAEGVLPKMLAPGTFTENPELVKTVRQIMETASVEGVIGSLYGMKNRSDSTPTLAEIDKPTLILHGAEDQLMGVDNAEVMHRGIHQSILRVLPASGHLLNMEQPALFNQAIREFLETL